MKKKLFLASAFISLWGVTAQAQTPVAIDRKWDAAVEHLFQAQKNQVIGLKSTTNAEKQGFIVACSDAETVAEQIRLAGHEATIINKSIISATLPVNFVKTLANMDEVNYINGSRQLYPSLHTSRAVTSADKVQKGEGLETPFTGKGVIVGVIDQGFQYKHSAFLDENNEPRVRAVWNHQAFQRPTENIPNSGDNMPYTHGHGTHVTNIAAGSKIKENDYYGMAPDAEIIMIPSTFEDTKVLEEAKYISDFAKKEGKPFVINMSFGSQMGPHDGTDNYSLGMNGISQPGGILVAAMGNEGDLKLHAHHEFTEDNEKVFLIVKPDEVNSYSLLDLWEQTGDGKKHLKIRPFVFTSSPKKQDFKDQSFWNTCLTASGNVEPNNQKEHFFFQVNTAILKGSSDNKYFGIEIEGNAGDVFHAWVNPTTGEFYNAFGKGYLKGDNEYCVGEGAASVPYAVAVASYNGNDGKFTSAVTGQKLSYGGRKGDISSFSSRGPSLGAEPKPLVAAPGHCVASAISRYGRGFDSKSTDIVSIIKNGINKDYYAVMSGTSMASPTVTGIIALWLEANPSLTYEQVKEIIKTTSNLDTHTGTRDKWDNKRGYGKINAYEGLKKALLLAESSGINDQLNSETPVTLQKEDHQFRVLFNNDESYATLSLFNASGVEVKKVQLNRIRRGQETVLSTAGLPAGVYMVRIQTTASTMAKKMLVK